MTELIAPILILACGALIQGAVGFAYGLFVIPCLLALGFSLPECIAIGGPCVFFQTVTGVLHFRKDGPWKDMKWPFVFIILGAVVGTILLWSLARLDRVLIKQLVGGVLIALLLLQALLNVKPRPRIHPFWGILACGTGGILGGMTGMGGPPIVLWVNAHDWSTRTVRVVKWSLFMIFAPLVFPFLLYRYGTEILQAYKIGLFAIPAVYPAARAGMWIGDRFSKKLLRTVTITLLWGIALTSISAPWLS